MPTAHRQNTNVPGPHTVLDVATHNGTDEVAVLNTAVGFDAEKYTRYLITTKIHVPRSRADTITRPRLDALLDASLAAPLTLVTGPPGSGKTTIIAEWAWRRALPVAWLSLDQADNDPATLLRYIVAALRVLDPAIGATTLAMLHTPRLPEPETVWPPMLNELGALRQDVLLVLDDYHVLQAPAAHAMLRFLLQHLPPPLHLVVISREDPPLPLAAMRGRGRLVEIRAADLHFTSDEVASFLRDGMGLAVSDDDVAVLETRTEGWAVGLYLAGRAMRDRPDPGAFIRTFTGSHRYVVDYLVEEVLALVPGHLHDFLLRTSILRRLTAPLCDALLLGDDAPATSTYSQILLDQLEAMNLFLHPLDDERRWYRYHQLFADVLRERLRVGATRASVATLHERASAWFEEEELFGEAIEHALAGQSWERAGRLIQHHSAVLFNQGEYPTVADWLQRIPVAVVRSSARLSVMRAHAALLMTQFDDAETWLGYAEDAARGTPEENNIMSEVVAGQAYLTHARNDFGRAIELARRALDFLKPDQKVARGRVLLVLGTSASYLDQLSTTLEAYAEAERLASATGDIHTALQAIGSQAMTWSNLGQLRRAVASYQRGIRLAATHKVDRAPFMGVLHGGLAGMLYEWNDLEGSDLHTQIALDLSRHSARIHTFLWRQIRLALLAHARGDVPEALRVLEETLELAGQHNLQRQIIIARAARVRLWLVHGDVASADAWARTSGLTIDDEVDTLHEPEYVALARVLIRRGEAANALKLIRRLRASAEEADRTWILIELLGLEALALQADGESSTALETLTRALVLAEPEGYIRTFVDEGTQMARVLHQFETHDDAINPTLRAYSARLLAAFPPEQRPLPVEQAPPSLPPAPQSIAPMLLADPLSERELQVLKLVAQGLTNRVIAEQLIISPHTVNMHLRSIFGKLDVTSRAAATRFALEHGLV